MTCLQSFRSEAELAHTRERRTHMDWVLVPRLRLPFASPFPRPSMTGPLFLSREQQRMKVLEETSAVTRLARLRSMVFDAVERCRLLRSSRRERRWYYGLCRRPAERQDTASWRNMGPGHCRVNRVTSLRIAPGRNQPRACHSQFTECQRHPPTSPKSKRKIWRDFGVTLFTSEPGHSRLRKKKYLAGM